MEADRIDTGSLKTKCWANVEAVALLKQIESEGRGATETEKRQLAR